MPLFLALFLACVDDVSTGKTDVVVNAAPTSDPTPVKAAAPVASQTWPIDVTQSDIHALGAKVTGTETVKFSRWSGAAQVAGGVVQSIAVDIDVTSLDAGKPKLNNHLNSPDFFDTAQNPKATFQSIRIQEGSTGKGMTHTVTGDLTMRGVTNSVTFPMKLVVSGDKLTAESEFAINRFDWKIEYKGAADDLVQDKVLLTVKLVATSPDGSTAQR